MEYRKLPHGEEQISVLGLGMGGIQKSSDAEIEQVIRKAIAHGINFFDLCAGGQQRPQIDCDGGYVNVG